MKEKQKTLLELVKKILTEKPETRDSDLKLIIEYCNYTGKSTNLKDWETGGYNSFESISRCRRKIQSVEPSLKSSPLVTSARERLQEYVKKTVLEG